MTVDERVPPLIQSASQAQQTVVPARGPNAFGAHDPDGAVAGNTVEADRRRRQKLSRECLDGIAPQARYMKSHDRVMSRESRS